MRRWKKVGKIKKTHRSWVGELEGLYTGENFTISSRGGFGFVWMVTERESGKEPKVYYTVSSGKLNYGAYYPKFRHYVVGEKIFERLAMERRPMYGSRI